jgi:glycosyltransferase involved in cell wall biosynthesis
MRTYLSKPTVLQLAWDDVFNTYGGIQTQVMALMERNTLSKAKTIARTLPTLHASLIRGTFGPEQLGLQNFESDLETTVMTEKVDIIQSHNIHRPEGIGVADAVNRAIERLGIPHVATVHDLIESDSPAELQRQKKLLAGNVIVTTSEFNYVTLSRLLKLDSKVIPPCLPRETASLRNADKSVPTIAAPGRLLPQKGLREAIIIAGHLSRELGKMRVLLSNQRHAHNGGRRYFLEEIERIAGCFPQLQLIFFDGDQAYPNLYRSADLVLCLPTAQEGFGLIPLESVASGVPVIVVPNGGLEWVKEFPSSIFVENRDYIAIASRALSILKERLDWKERVRNDQAIILANYSPVKMIERYECVYEGISGGMSRLDKETTGIDSRP